MNVKNIRSKKALKFLGLLISAMLIATVSAITYRYMYIDGSITVGGAYMVWLEGADLPGAPIAGSTATVNLDVEQGTPLNFTEALFLKNQHSTDTFNYSITVTNNVSSANFQRAKMLIYENYTAGPTWTYLDTLDLTNPASSYDNSLANGTYLRMTFEVNATIASGNFDFDVQVEYWKP